jgi:hypothetical protein
MPKLPAHLAALPYQIHTNRELGLMLRGVKPLAVFSDWYDRRSDVLERYLRFFDRYVSEGKFARREYVQWHRRGGWRGAHVFLYALPEEEWRIDAMIELRVDLSGWSAAHGRRQGELLGYEEWQNDIWIARNFKTRP